jgi:hypothetical protein
MKRLLLSALLLASMNIFSQEKNKPLEIFSSQKVINANTPELTGKGKMDFLVTHNFEDIGGSRGGIKNFFGLDNSTDVRIGFIVGVGKNMDVFLSRVKAAGNISRLVETGFKYRFLRQTEDNSTPLSLAFFFNNTISTMKASDSPLDENYFLNFSKRTSQIFQLIAAKKIGKISVQLNPTFLTQGHVVPGDQQNMFALGAALRIPAGKRFNILVDYFHPFRSDASKAFNSARGFDFHDPLGVGFEIITGRHVFHLNFTNTREILENRLFPASLLCGNRRNKFYEIFVATNAQIRNIISAFVASFIKNLFFLYCNMLNISTVIIICR